MIHFYCAELNGVLIRPLHMYDIEYLREWRNRDDLSTYLSKRDTISKEAQEKWFGDYLNNEDIIFFAIDYARKKTVGSLALYGFEGDKCQIGKVMIGDEESRGHHIAEKAFLMAMGIANAYLGVKSFELTVHEDNGAAKTTYERLGFRKYGFHEFEKGGKEEEMSVDYMTVMNNELSSSIVFYKENDDITRKWIDND